MFFLIFFSFIWYIPEVIVANDEGSIPRNVKARHNSVERGSRDAADCHSNDDGTLTLLRRNSQSVTVTDQVYVDFVQLLVVEVFTSRKNQPRMHRTLWIFV
jgi:hypothetical protein